MTERDEWEEKEAGGRDCFETGNKFHGAVLLKDNPQISQIPDITYKIVCVCVCVCVCLLMCEFFSGMR